MPLESLLPFSYMRGFRGGRGGPGSGHPPPWDLSGGVLCTDDLWVGEGVQRLFLSYYYNFFTLQYCNRVNVWTILITSNSLLPYRHTRYPWLLWKCTSIFILLKITRFKRKKILGEDPQTPPPSYNCNITKTLNNAKTINSNMFWRVENSEKRSYLWKDIALKAVTMAKLDFDHTYAEYTLKRPPSSFVFCLSNFSRRLDPLWRKFLDPRLSYIEQSLKTYPFIYWSF